MTDVQRNPQQRLKREAIYLLILLAIGLLLLPVLTYFVGAAVFGPYQGDGLGQFVGNIYSRLGSGDWPAWLLVLSPLLGITFLRLLALGWRSSRRTA